MKKTGSGLPTKPFGIRGDRLLLFLDIAQSFSYLDENKQTSLGWGGQFSKAAVLRLLWDKLGIKDGCEDTFAKFYDETVAAMRSFLRSNAMAIGNVEFDGYHVLTAMGIKNPNNCSPSTYGWYIVSIFTNVAVGKYTRENFE